MSNAQTPPRQKPNGNTPHPEGGRKLRLLLIENEEGIHKLFRASFTDWDIDSAFTKEEAEAKLEANGHQVIVLDIRLPGVVGYEMMDRIRDRFGLPVVVVSAGVNDETYTGFLKHGAFAVLEKGPPWMPWKIRDAVELAWARFSKKLDERGIDTVVTQLRAHIKRLRGE